jgi:hypothetical protein
MLTDDRIIGVSDHGGWAMLVTVAGDGTLLDRRRVELVDEDLPKIPHHSERARTCRHCNLQAPTRLTTPSFLR